MQNAPQPQPQPQPQDNMNVQPTTPEAAPAPQPTDTAPAAPVEPATQQPTAEVPTEAASTEATQQQDMQVIDGVAQGLADDAITAEDIMVAVLSDSLGLSPNGARSLFQLLIQDLAEDAQAEAQDTSVEQPPME